MSVRQQFERQWAWTHWYQTTDDLTHFGSTTKMVLNSCSSAIRQPIVEWHHINKDTKWGYRSLWWWWLMVIVVTFGVTERHSLCSYQCGNGGGVHWSVSCRHQHRLQNNRRERVIVQSMQMGTGEEQEITLCVFVSFFLHQRGHIHSHRESGQRSTQSTRTDWPRLANMNIDIVL